MFFYHFLQLCPRGHVSKMLAVTIIENTVLRAFSNPFPEFSNHFPGHVSKMLAVIENTVIRENTVLRALGIFKSVSCLFECV